MPRFVLLFILIALNACANTVTPRPEIESSALLEERHIQRKIALQQNIDDSNRLQNVAYPLLAAAVPLCESQLVRRIGLDVATVFDFEQSYQRAAAEVLNLGSAISVVGVIEGGPADMAGIKLGDTLLAINGNPLVTGANATSIYHNLLEEELAADHSLILSIERDSRQLDYSLSAVRVCDYPVVLLLDDELNAYADGNAVYITRRMLRFAEDDKELALVIAHELAHNIMEHSDKRRQNAWLGRVIDLAAITQGWDTEGLFGELSGNVYSQEFEVEADYVGMYIMALTGMDLDGAAYFWRRMAVESPGNIDTHSASHPATAERFLALEQAVSEIENKKATGVPLRPERKQ